MQNSVKVDHCAYIWHPNVHHYFLERLYFFLIEMSRYAPGKLADQSKPSKSTLDKIHETLERVAAYGHCIYEVFGDVDLLVGVWLDDVRYEALGKAIGAEPGVMRVIPFFCEGEDYLWARQHGLWRDISEKDVAKHQERIKRCTAPGAGDRRNDAAMQKEWKILEKEGLVLGRIDRREKEQDETKAIKFFSLFKLVQKLAAEPHHVADLVSHKCQRFGDRVSDLSLYWGNCQIGAQFMLKGMAKNYYDVYHLVVEMFSATELDAPPHTYLVASSTWDESDDLGTPGALSNIKAKRIITFTGMPLDMVVGLDMDDPKMTQLMEAYDSVSPLLFMDEERLLSVLVEGLLDENERTVKMGVTFLFDIEMYMKPYFFKRVQQSNAKRNAHRLIAQTVDELREDASRSGDKNAYSPPDLKDFTFQDYSVFLGKLCEDDDVAKVLGNTWKQDIETTRVLRNDVAHGRFTNVIEEWSEHIARIAPAMALYYRLRRWHAEKTRSDEGENGVR